MFGKYKLLIINNNIRVGVTLTGRHVTFTGMFVTFAGGLCDVYRSFMWRIQEVVTFTGPELKNAELICTHA